MFSQNEFLEYVIPIQIFQEVFPNVYEVFMLIKEGHHPTLAVVLQNLEAELVLHTTCKIISEENPEVPLLTIHDSIVTTEDYAEYVQDKLHQVLENAIGLKPTIKLEPWQDDKKVA